MLVEVALPASLQAAVPDVPPAEAAVQAARPAAAPDVLRTAAEVAARVCSAGRADASREPLGVSADSQVLAGSGGKAAGQRARAAEELAGFRGEARELPEPVAVLLCSQMAAGLPEPARSAVVAAPLTCSPALREPDGSADLSPRAGRAEGPTARAPLPGERQAGPVLALPALALREPDFRERVLTPDSVVQGLAQQRLAAARESDMK